MHVIKGQNFRLFVNDKCIGASQSCEIHVSANLETSSSKDDTDDFQRNETTGMAWDGSVNAFVMSDEDAQAIGIDDALDLIGQEVSVKYQEVTGDKNRSAKLGGISRSSKAIVSDVKATFGNRANSTWDLQLTGNGPLTKE